MVREPLWLMSLERANVCADRATWGIGGGWGISPQEKGPHKGKCKKIGHSH